MEPTSKDYRSYMLRMWRVRGDVDHWRASLEEVLTRKLHGFSDLTELQEYLEAITAPEQPDTAVLADQEEFGW